MVCNVSSYFPVQSCCSSLPPPGMEDEWFALLASGDFFNYSLLSIYELKAFTTTLTSFTEASLQSIKPSLNKHSSPPQGPRGGKKSFEL